MPVGDDADIFHCIVLVSLIGNTNAELQLTQKKSNGEMHRGMKQRDSARFNG